MWFRLELGWFVERSLPPLRFSGVYCTYNRVLWVSNGEGRGLLWRGTLRLKIMNRARKGGVLKRWFNAGRCPVPLLHNLFFFFFVFIL